MRHLVADLVPGSSLRLSDYGSQAFTASPLPQMAWTAPQPQAISGTRAALGPSAYASGGWFLTSSGAR